MLEGCYAIPAGFSSQTNCFGTDPHRPHQLDRTDVELHCYRLGETTPFRPWPTCPLRYHVVLSWRRLSHADQTASSDDVVDEGCGLQRGLKNRVLCQKKISKKTFLRVEHTCGGFLALALFLF